MEPLNRPPARAKVAPFFVINGRSDKPRLDAMMSEFAEAGYDAAILHPRAGLRMPYLSEVWFQTIDHCVQTAARHGMKVWLYDEYPYPSGVAGGRVLARNPEFAELHLDIRRFKVEGGAKVSCEMGAGRLLAAFLIPRSDAEELCWRQAREVTSQCGVYNSTWINRAHDSRFYYSLDHAQLYKCHRAMEYLPVNVFEGEVPSGTWELVSFFKVTGGDTLEPYGHYVDVSNGEATAAFMEETHEAYRQWLGDRFGAEIEGIFTDEPKYRNPLPWSKTIASHWREWQLDRRSLLGLLPDYPGGALRRSYREVGHQLFLDQWIHPIRNWCDQNSMQLGGHISPEEDWWAESRCAGSILPLIRNFHTPGCDLIIPAVGDRLHPILNSTPTMAVSAAAQSGAPHALCEMLACSDYSVSMQTIKRIGDWLATFGINFAVPHGCFQSLEGLRRYDAPPTFIEPSTNHRYMRQWTEHFRATASRLGPRNVKVETAIVRPMRNLFGIAEEEEARELTREVHALGIHLLERGISFHWVDDEDLVSPIFEEGALRIGEAQYRRLIVPLPLVERAAAGLDACRKAGVAVLDPAGAREVPGPLECKEGDVRAVRSTRGETFCVNLSEAPRTFRLEGRQHALEGYESRWVEPGGRQLRSVEMMRLSPGQWEVMPEGANSFRLLHWSCDGTPVTPGPIYQGLPGLLGPQTELTVYGPVPTEARLPGLLHLQYETTFEWEGASASLALVIEKGSLVGERRVFLNDRELAEWKLEGTTEALPRERHEVVPLPGRNRLRIELATGDRRDGMLAQPYLEGTFRVLDATRAHLAEWEGALKGGDWAADGFPHYSGTMCYETFFPMDRKEDLEGALYLEFSEPPASMVEVSLNGIDLGALLWAPWRIDLSPALVVGENRLCLRVTNTLYNFMYGEPKPSGMMGEAVLVKRLPVALAKPARPLSALHAMTLVETALALGLMAFCTLSLLGLLPVMFSAMADSRERMLGSRIYQKVAIALREAPPEEAGTQYFTLEGAALPAGQMGDIRVSYTSPAPLQLPEAGGRYQLDTVSTVEIEIQNSATRRPLIRRSLLLPK